MRVAEMTPHWLGSDPKTGIHFNSQARWGDEMTSIFGTWKKSNPKHFRRKRRLSKRLRRAAYLYRRKSTTGIFDKNFFL